MDTTEAETTLAKNIHAASENAQYDAACKRVLSDKYVLAWIMKSCLNEYQQCTIEEIAEKYIEGQPSVDSIPVNPDETNPVIHGLNNEDKTITEGTVVYDIRFSAYAPGTGELIRLIINVEAHQSFSVGYPLLKRAVYYCSRMISSQYGSEFTETHYEKIRKVYSIWICPNPPKKRENTITRYCVQEENLVGQVLEQKENYDLLTVVMICLGLGHAGDDNYRGILKLLGVLLSSEKEAEEKKKILQEDFDIAMTKTLESEVSAMCNLSKGVEERGIAIGLERGMERGLETGTLNAIRKLMETLKLTAEQAMEALKVPEEEKVKYAGMLKG